MKQLLMLLFALGNLSCCLADCGSNGLWVSPSKGTIKQNNRFLLEEYGYSKSILDGLNSKYPIYLKSGEKIVRLSIIETHEGQQAIKQVLLKPETDLEAGLTYTLIIDSLPEDEVFANYNIKTGKNEPYTYQVSTEKDNQAPTMTGTISYNSSSYLPFGCGPAEYAIFSCAATDESPIWIRTTVKSLKTGITTTYIIPLTLLSSVKGLTIHVGHSMCEGPFRFDDGDEYEASFTFMDLCGNEQAEANAPIKFPRPSREEE